MVSYPSDWKREKLGDCIDRYINGTSLEEFFTKNSSNRVISLGNYSEDGKYIDDGNRIVINSKTLKYLVDKDDLCMVLNDKGNGRLVGKVILVEKDNEYIINQRSLRLVINKDKVLSIFLHQLINSEVFRSKLVKYIQGNTQVYINPPAIMEIEIDIPKNRDEQKAISKVLLSFDKHIGNLSKLIEKKKMIRDGAVEDLISGDSRLSTFSDEWINNKMEDIAVINQGLQIPISSRQTYKTKNNYLYITIEFLKENNSKRYYVENPPTNTVCNKDSILMTRTGNTGQVVTGVSGVFHNNFFDIKYDKSKIDNNFLYYLLISKRYNTEIINVAGVSTIPDLKHKDFYNISINYPKDIKEQKEIAKILMSMDKEIENLEKEKEKYLQLKSGAMDDLLTGRIRLV